MKSARSLVYGDKMIWAIYFVLCAISLIELFSASSTLAHRGSNLFGPVSGHIQHLAIGFIVVVCVSNIHYEVFKYFMYPLYVLLILSMIYLVTAGSKINDATRWFTLMGINIQPSEFVKVFLAFYIPYKVLEIDNEDRKAMGKMLLWITILMSLLVFFTISENLSTVILWVVIILIMFFLHRMNFWFLFKYVFVPLASLLFLAIVFIKLFPDSKPAHRASVWESRVMEHKKEEVIPSASFNIPSKQYQPMHAKMGIANGCGSIKFWGKGPGNGVERNYLPEAYSDFIFAIIAEECGWVGVFIVILCYFGILVRSRDIMSCCNNRYAAGLVMCSSVIISLQAVFNMFVSVSIFPVTGQTLPLVSKGGSSIIVFSVLIGIIQSVCKYAADTEQLNAEFEEDEKN
ncbi:MAG TPA: hypothetical protein DDY68_06310 [Porphyromonadaceae bacterium]|nr:hypothetical protein [Porphyromonadaceae bacterium]